MQPEEVAQAAKDLNTKLLLPVHWAKYTLALHPWNEPIKRIKKLAEDKHIPITTPMIGETVVLDSVAPASKWYNN
jgi:L-ascorbate metabolism protein UlaG (beta-lactamase superfamily)